MKKTNCFFKVVIVNFNNSHNLRRCVDSFLQQKFDDVSIVIVDDMSQDDSRHVIQEYADAYANVFCCFPSEKSYAGKCRNYGIDYPISSQYTWIVDSDDYAVQDSLQLIYEICINQHFPQLITIGHYKGDDVVIPSIMTNDDLMTGIATTWSKIVKSSDVVRFEDCLCANEDVIQHIKQIDVIDTFAAIQKPLYHYTIQKNSLSNNNSIDAIYSIGLYSLLTQLLKMKYLEQYSAIAMNKIDHKINNTISKIQKCVAKYICK